MPVKMTAIASASAPTYRSRRKAGINATPKKPPAIVAAATGALIRASHFDAGVNVAESSSTWITNDRITHTPACACPARNSAHCLSSNSSPGGARPAAPFVRRPRMVSPPY